MRVIVGGVVMVGLVVVAVREAQGWLGVQAGLVAVAVAPVIPQAAMAVSAQLSFSGLRGTNHDHLRTFYRWYR